MNQPLIEVRDVARVFRSPLFSAQPPVHALRGVSLDVAAGETFGIVGESGSGKSTLGRLLMGLDRPTRGTITFAGRRIDTGANLPFLRRQMQLVFQDPMGSFDPRMRVHDIVREPLHGLGVPGDHRHRVHEVLDAVGLPPDAARRYPHQFSGGQRQRIAIARALAPRPHALIADEPVSALDVSVRAQILDLLVDLTRVYGLTLLLVSHDLAVVRYLTDRVAVMRDGEIVETGPTQQVYASPRDPYTAQLIAAIPRLRR
ncbi:MAG: ATP-binding cassette domain-containing protein [Streptosporangiales bacterium]|nr:ATP-binding cassette domain-containing protein [Streptosporangiales bacterium]